MARNHEEDMGQAHVSTKRKSNLVAYLFWFFLGIFAAHRFYLRRNGWLQLFTILLFGIGLLWVLADLFLIPGMVRDHNEGRSGSGSSSGGGGFLKVVAIVVVGVIGLGVVGYMMDPEGYEERLASYSPPDSSGQPANESNQQTGAIPVNEEAEKPSTRTPSQNQRYVQLRETVEGERISVAVLSVSTTLRAGSQFIGEDAQPGALFVVVEYEYTNISDGPIGSFNAPVIKLVAPSGTEYKSDGGATGLELADRDLNENFFSDLNPLITYRSVELFEIAEQLYQRPGWEIKVELDRGDFYVRIDE